MIAKITKFYMLTIVIWLLLSLFTSGAKAVSATMKNQLVVMANSNLNIAWQLRDFLNENNGTPLDTMMREIQADIERDMK